MARLDYTSMNGTDRHLKDALAFDSAEFVPFAFEGGKLGAQIEIFAEGKDLRPIIMKRAAARVWVADEFETKHVLNFTLLPVDPVDCICERREFRFIGRDRNTKNEKAMGGVEGEDLI